MCSVIFPFLWLKLRSFVLKVIELLFFPSRIVRFHWNQLRMWRAVACSKEESLDIRLFFAAPFNIKVLISKALSSTGWLWCFARGQSERPPIFLNANMKNFSVLASLHIEIKDVCFLLSVLHPFIYLLPKSGAEFVRSNIYIATFCSKRLPSQSGV